MIHYHQYAVKASTLGEACDEVHRDLCERGCVLGDGDFVEWGVVSMHKVLVLLTDSAPLYILFHPGPCSRPEIVVVDLLNRLISSSMPSSFVLVPYSQDFSFHFVIWGHYQPVA